VTISRQGLGQGQDVMWFLCGCNLLLYKYIIGQEQNDGVHEDDEEAEQENARTQQHLSQ
jgi:hypothetical protein